jgi:excisionase family DNA binding protein
VDFDPLLEVPEAADLLRIHPKTVQAWARAGRLSCLRMGKYWRFRKSALKVWVSEQLESSHQSRRVS